MSLFIQAIMYFFRFLEIMIIIRVIISWIPNINMYSSPVRFIYRVTEPILSPIREFMLEHINLGPIDISPIVVLLLLDILKRAILRILFMF